MSRLFTIFLVALYGLTLSQAYMPHVNYWMNRDYIASELCENKDKPELHCDGKCQLQKDIREHDENRSEDQEVMSLLMLEFAQETPTIAFEILDNCDERQYDVYTEPLITGVSSSIFRPPKA